MSTRAREIAELGQKLSVDASGNIDVNGSVTANTVSVDSDLTVGGTVDGRDVATDGTKLDGIEAGADVTDTANVTAAGALMDSELTDIAAVKALDQGVATTDDPTFTNTQLAEIAATISDTAVDVFVYDTSKDSDGGAWRKRTQHTSWYNETLNTATRGSRKEFPSVAVIVAEADTVTIYDGDDPSLPMWMVFNVNGTNNFLLISVGSTTALNGKIALGLNTDFSRLMLVDFLAEESYWITSSSVTVKTQGIASRNSTTANVASSNYGTIVHATVNDVAMTVLPNAPIDAATGLPVPTIAVATDGGWSQISDDGNVYDFAFSTNPKVTNISFKNDTTIAWNGDSNQFIYDRGYFEHPLLTTDKTSQNVASFTEGVASYEYGASTASRYPTPIPDAGDGNNHSISNVIGNKQGLSLYDALLENRVTSTGSKGMVAYVASDYATGWQNGAIKLATLSDTDDTDVTGSELVTNGTFDSDTSGWTVGSTSTATIVSGKLEVTSTSTSDRNVRQSLSVVAGKTYVFQVDSQTSPASGGARVRIGNTNGGFEYVDNVPSGTYTSYSYTFTPTQSTIWVTILPVTDGTTITRVDNVSVRLAEEDRSVNGNGLQVFGTVTKNPVATGADLVAYSGFSTSNYLEQPYNSDLDFGTGDFCVMGWFKESTTSGTSHMLDRGDGSSDDYRFVLYRSSGSLLFRTRGNGIGTTVTQTVTSSTPTGVWTNFCIVRQNGIRNAYLNGVLQASNADTTDLNNTSASLFVGVRMTLIEPSTASLALLRISATAPTAEQIAKIYEDEKVLFQENAQATLYGSSDAVTALAYDDSTELLHVGTSAGRSDFQGLRRVNNTTNAVGAAISASNGMIVEE